MASRLAALSAVVPSSVTSLAVASLLLVAGGVQCSAQASSQSAPGKYLTYFLSHPVDPAELNRVPANARDVIVAKIKLAERPVYLIGRGQSGLPPLASSDLFAVRIEIIATLRGEAVAGTRQDVYFGTTGGGRNYKYPIGPSPSEYFVASYLSPDGKRRLLEFRISEQEFNEWMRARLERPGAHDR